MKSSLFVLNLFMTNIQQKCYVEENKATIEMIDIAIGSLNQWGKTLATKQPFSLVLLVQFLENAKTVGDKIRNIQQLKLASQTN